MPGRLEIVLRLSLTCLLVGAVVLLGARPAAACSCAAIDPVDAVAMAEVVFTGVLVGSESGGAIPSWRFAVDGVIKGEVDHDEVVDGDDWQSGCGTDFGQFQQSIVVYADRDGERLRSLGCMPTPTAASFAARLATLQQPSGSGPPAALLSGRFEQADFAVLDGSGRALALASVGASGVVAHCAGTTRAVVVAWDSRSTVSIVDLETLAVVETRPIDVDFLSPTGDRVQCLDGGDRVVVSRGYGPNDGEVTVATSNADGAGRDRARAWFDRTSRAVLLAGGDVLLLPSRPGGAITRLSSDDLEELPDTEVELPDGVAIIDGDISPDGSMLAMLATIDGVAVEYDTGATHVVSIPLVDGRLQPESIRMVELEPADGAAKWIRWQTGDRWVVERETPSSKVLEILATDGSRIFGPTDIGWGWGLVPVSSGILRARNGGVEVIGPDQPAVPGYPAPAEGYLDRRLAVAGLVDAPTFTPRPSNPIAPLRITPVVAAEAESTGTSPQTSAAGSPDSQTSTAAPVPRSDEGTSNDGTPIVRGLLAAAAIAVAGPFAVVMWRRARRRSTVASSSPTV